MEVRLGTVRISETGEQKIIFENEIGIDTFKKSKENITRIYKYVQHTELYSMFLINFIELSSYFKETVDYLTRKQVIMLESSSEDFQNVKKNSNRLLLNLLSSGRTLIDHQETYLKRQYGKQSPEIISYKGITSEMYDAYFEYRFMYKLRNYAQHCGLPIGQLEFTAENIREGNARKIQTILTPLFIRDELLSNFDGWGKKVKIVLENQPAKFSAMLSIKTYYTCIESINKHFEIIELNKLKSSVEELQELLRNFKELNKEASPYVFYDFQYSNEESLQNLNFTMLSIPKTEIENIAQKISIIEDRL